MRTYDFAPLSRSSVGFDRLFDLINNNAQRLNGQETNFPRTTSPSQRRLPHHASGRWLAPEEITITAQQNLLAVAGQKKDAGDTNIYTVASRRRASTSNSTWRTTSRLTGASFENGLLQIELVRKIPKP